MAASRFTFRQSFNPVLKESLQWYPGHMNKSFTKMQAQIKQVDCIVEVHDARLPFSGRNPNFVKRLIGSKPHILVLNKKDLIGNDAIGAVNKRIKAEIENVLYTNCKDQLCRGLKRLVPRSIDLILNSNRFNRSEEKKLRMMVIGVPNVGKSSLINALRNRILHRGKATAVGAIAGVTRTLLNEIKINISPPVYLVDTPGILPPNIVDMETGMKLALCSCLNDEVVGIEQIADYQLFWLNKHKFFSYVDYFNFKEPCDEISVILASIAKQQNKFLRIRDFSSNSDRIVYDFRHAAHVFVNAFRSCKLGVFCLDIPEASLPSTLHHVSEI